MNLTKQHIGLASLVVLATAVTYVAVTLGALLLGWAMAHAADTPLPVDDYSLVERYGFSGGLLMVFAVASKLLARPDVSHWLKERRWLAIVAGGVAVIAAGLNWRINGGDPEAVTLALSTAIGLVLSPQVSAAGGST